MSLKGGISIDLKLLNKFIGHDTLACMMTLNMHILLVAIVSFHHRHFCGHQVLRWNHFCTADAVVDLAAAKEDAFQPSDRVVSIGGHEDQSYLGNCYCIEN